MQTTRDLPSRRAALGLASLLAFAVAATAATGCSSLPEEDEGELLPPRSYDLTDDAPDTSASSTTEGDTSTGGGEEGDSSGPKGGGGEGGTCGSIANVSAKPACDTCMRSKCCKYLTACDESPSCKLLGRCLEACSNDDTECILTCAYRHSAARTDYENIAACAQLECESECPVGDVQVDFDVDL